MLLSFKGKNFKSFKDEFIFSMEPVTRQTDLNYSILKKKVGDEVYRGLSSAVIYGPNAAGKSNIISAMDTFKNIILRGHIRNQKEHSGPNVASRSLELIPNISSKEILPTSLSIRFITQECLVEYSIEFLIGEFLETDMPRKIIEETLLINNKPIFVRESNRRLSLKNLESINEYLSEGVLEDGKLNAMITNIATNNLHQEELFLVNGFKNIFSTKLVNRITHWIEN